MAVVLATTNDGTLPRSCNAHYFAAIPDLVAAKALATTRDAVINTLGKYGTFPDDMLIANPNLAMGFYTSDKTVQSTGTKSPPFPNEFFAHTTGGARINVFNNNIWLMQADHAAPTPYNDPRGFTASRWRDWRGKDVWKVADAENAKYANDPYCIGYLDSMSATAGIGGAKPANWATNIAYTSDEFQDINKTVGDQTIANKAIGGRYVFANGFRSGPSYFPFGASGKTSYMIGHVDGGLAESWMRGNGDAATAFPNKTRVLQEIDILVDTNSRGVWCWCIVNINNATAGGSGFVPATFTAAQVEQWRRLCIATFMIGHNGRGLFEFVESTSKLPWADTHPYYDIALGVPLDNWTAASQSEAKNGTVTGVLSRRYTNGCVYVNVSGSSKTWTGDRTYKNLDGTAIPSNSITLADNSGLVVITTGSSGGGGGGGGSETLSRVLTDTFGRTVAAGSLGLADTGQAYTLKGTPFSDFSVDGVKAVINFGTGTGRYGTPVLAAALQDVECSIQIAFDEVPIGGNQAFYMWERADTVALTGYRLRIFITPAGAISWLQQTLVTGTATSIAGGATNTVAGHTYTANTIINAKFRVKGINPTTVQAKVWVEGDAEPATWQETLTDSNASLQISGGTAFQVFAEAGNTSAPTNFLNYNYTVDEITTTAGPPPNNPPNLTVLAPVDGSTITLPTVQLMNAQATDPDAGDSVTRVSVSIDSGAEQNLTSFANNMYRKSIPLPAGAHTIVFTAYDTSGATTAQLVNLTVLPDPTPPPAGTIDPGIVGVPAPSTQKAEWTIVHLDHYGRELGEVKGTDLRFGRYVMQSGFTSYEIAKYHPLASMMRLEAHTTDFSVRRNGVELLAGELNSVDRDTDNDGVQIAGNDWRTYLDKLPILYDPSKSLTGQNFAIASDPGQDLTFIVEALVNFVLSKYTNTIELTYNNQNTGIVQGAHFLATDLTSLTQMIDGLANQKPGFEWEITPQRELKIYSPRKGKQAQLILDPSNIKQIHYGEQGIPGTILYGRGTGTGSSAAIKRSDNVNARFVYRDRVAVADFGTVKSRAVLQNVTDKEIALSSNQTLSFWVTMMPQGVDVWSLAEDGDTIKVAWDDGDIQLNGFYRCMGYETYVNAQGDEEVVYNFDVTPEVQ